MKNHEEKANPLYPEIRNNITQAAQAGGIKLIITIDTSWVGDTTIYFWIIQCYIRHFKSRRMQLHTILTQLFGILLLKYFKITHIPPYFYQENSKFVAN